MDVSKKNRKKEEVLQHVIAYLDGAHVPVKGGETLGRKRSTRGKMFGSNPRNLWAAARANSETNWGKSRKKGMRATPGGLRITLGYG